MNTDIQEIIAEFKKKARTSFGSEGFLTTDYFDKFTLDEKLAADWLSAKLTALVAQTEKRVLERVEAIIPSYNRWNDTMGKEAYDKNSAVEDIETGRNPVLKELRAAIAALKSPNTTDL